MLEYMELRELSNRIGIPVRKLRYVLDHDLVPNRDWFVAEGEVGQPRRFDSITAFFIACAAFLLNAGHKRDAVREIMRSTAMIYPDGKNPLRLPLLANVIQGKSQAELLSGDGTHVRLRVGAKDSLWIACDDPKRRIKDFRPKVTVGVDVGLIRDLVLNREKSP